MSLQDLTAAITANNYVEANEIAQREVMRRISERMDATRDTISKTLFKESLTTSPCAKCNGAPKDAMKRVEDKDDNALIDKLTHSTKKAAEPK